MRASSLASLTGHVAEVERGISSGVFAEMRAVIQLVPLLVLLVVLAPRLAMSAAAALGGFAVVVLLARGALKRGHARAVRDAESLLGAADEAVRHTELWSTYGAERRIRRHLASLGDAILRMNTRLRAGAALLSGTSEVLGALALLLTLTLVSAGFMGDMQRDAVVPFAIAFFMAYRPLREIVEARLVKARATAALEATEAFSTGFRGARSVRGDRAARDEIEASGSAEHRSSPGSWSAEPLILERVRTRFGAHAPVSLRIPFGQIVAIVGPTGVGKTSLLRTLLGLDDVREGALFWGERELTCAGKGPSERPFAWAPQDAPILVDTLDVNVLLGGSHDTVGHDPPLDRHRRAVQTLEDLGANRLAHAFAVHDVMTASSISGGERSFLSVARAIASESPVLLLDEPTGALDTASQERMLAALANLRGKRTILLVTHRKEPLAIADVVVHLDALPMMISGQLEEADDGARGGRDVAAKELAVEDVGSLSVGVAKGDGLGERVDPRPE